jgi:hypothetical protein
MQINDILVPIWLCLTRSVSLLYKTLTRTLCQELEWSFIEEMNDRDHLPPNQINLQPDYANYVQDNIQKVVKHKTKSNVLTVFVMALLEYTVPSNQY